MRLVVTTWNLQGSAGVDRDAVVAHLQEQGSDVVLFQEVQRKQARRLARALSAQSLTWSLKHWTVSTRPEGMAVVGVTLPLDHAKARALTRRWRVWSWRRRIVQFARLEDLALANVHLTPHGEDGARAREVAAILHRFPTTGRTGRAVAGDFNARPGASLLGQLTSGGLHDAWVLAGAGGGDDDEREGATNWSSHRRVGAPDQRIDYLWVSPEVVVRGAWTPRYGEPGFEQFPRLSDHLPLTVELDMRRYDQAVLEDPLVPLPAAGRVFRAQRRVRLADASPSQRLRFDACARYLQDIGNDDTADSGLDRTAGVWVVRRAVVDLIVPPRWAEGVELATWCSGTGGRWAGRRLSITGDRGGQVEVDTLWVHLDPATLVPARLPPLFLDLYGEAAEGRRISARHWLTPPPDDGHDLERLAWPLRAVDLDVMGHVNNTAYWAAVEEVLAAHRDHPAHPARGGPLRAVLEFGSGIPRGAQVELLVDRADKQLDVWLMVDGTAHAAARLFPLPTS